MPQQRFNKDHSGSSTRSRSGRRFGSSAGGFNKSGGRPGGFSRGGSGGGFNRGGRPQQKRGGYATQSFSDISKFINKAVITEEVVKFIPEHRFADFALVEPLQRNLKSKGYEQPTPIQDRAIPHVMRGADVVGIANTGTGKTAAFLLPLINKIILDGRRRDARVLIMVPTRELAVQINDEFRAFANGLGLYSVVCVGGANISPQIRELKRAPHFVIGTPGRLKDLLERKALSLGDFKTAVLDEADRMLDMGFINDMREILGKLPTPRHTLFFSATLSPEIEKLIGEFLREPVRISVKTRDTSATIDQDIVRIPRGTDKVNVLHELLIKPGFDKVLVFGRTKHGVEKLAKKLVQLGFKAESIHGNKTQGKRQKALDLFKRDQVQVLCATDVAARGLDISGVSHVINFDLPSTHDDYIHRIGRTGRAGKAGVALTFIES